MVPKFDCLLLFEAPSSLASSRTFDQAPRVSQAKVFSTRKTLLWGCFLFFCLKFLFFLKRGGHLVYVCFFWKFHQRQMLGRRTTVGGGQSIAPHDVVTPKHRVSDQEKGAEFFRKRLKSGKSCHVMFFGGQTAG